MTKHNHHIVPKHRGGTDEDGLVEVSVTQHAMFHYCEWRLWGHWQDKTAWRMLAGLQESSREGTTHTEESKRKQSEAHKKLWKDPDYVRKTKQAMKEAAARPERKEQLRKQGKATISKLTPEQLEKGRKNSIKTCTIVHRVEKDGVVEFMTKKEFIAKHGGNLSSLKQMVWRKGAYKGWKFSR
ncbi:homing endonuclease [Synechococcus phage S-N03]|uniref:Homing endonuclease n=1 Tax=Synechococcus phage S-N03 TaxID=2718943 RepID=A0A6G8R5R8_9CAUD|nr:homing endonuclease [Synechococcus phage S-N03]QIN96745.1 homing endonuclease [Synechococcus phage S-N03]